MQVSSNQFWEQCAQTNNQILEALGDLGIAIRGKDTHENYLHKILTPPILQAQIKNQVQENIQNLDHFLDLLLYLFEKSEQMLQMLRFSDTHKASEILTFIEEQSLSLLVVLQHRAFKHEQLYLEVQQSEALLNILLAKIRLFSSAETSSSLVMMKIELQDTLHDLVLGHRNLAHHLRKFTQLQEIIAHF